MTIRSSTSTGNLGSERGVPPLAQIIALMRAAHGRDLALFDEAFLAKSLQRRLDGAGLAGWPAYLDRLAQDGVEAQALLASLNIGYSEFFREPLAFAWLEQVILPGLLQQSGEAGLRVWSAGCAAGQEAWSIAILLDEQNAERGQPVPLRIFATDRVQTVLAEAREGVYDAASVQQLRLKHLRRYFTVTGDAVGALTLYAGEANFFDDAIQKLLIEMAADISFAMDSYAAMAERKRAEIKMAEQLDELRRWQQMTLGRENRVLAMKNEVNSLLAERGQPPRYPSAVQAETEL